MRRYFFVLMGFLSLAGCEERYKWRQKITVTIETPSGEVSGSSVSEVSWQKNMFKDGMGWTYHVTAEAVVVEVVPGSFLFALLEGPDLTVYMGAVAPAAITGQKSTAIDPVLFDEVRDKRNRAAGPIVVPEYQYPILVTFEDVADPNSVMIINPTDLETVFGAGARLKSIVVEVTDEPVTDGRVKEILRWLGPFAESRLLAFDPNGDDSLVTRLDHGFFIIRR